MKANISLHPLAAETFVIQAKAAGLKVYEGRMFRTQKNYVVTLSGAYDEAALAHISGPLSNYIFSTTKYADL